MPVDVIASAPRPARARKPKGAAVADVPPVDPAPEPTATDYREAAELFKMLSDATRLRVLTVLNDGPLNVGELCRAVGGPEGPISQPACSHHLALCRHARLIEPVRSGKNNVYSCTRLGHILAELARPLVRDGSAR